MADLNGTGRIIGSLGGMGQIGGGLVGSGSLSGSLSQPEGTVVITYDGPYDFTPTQETQTVLIENKMATDNITINPIPSNYGLITWNGSVLTVS